MFNAFELNRLWTSLDELRFVVVQLKMLRLKLLQSESSCEELKEQVNDLALTKHHLGNDIAELQQDNARLKLTEDKHDELQQAYTEQASRHVILSLYWAHV